VAFALGGLAVALGLTRADSPASVSPDPLDYRLPTGLHAVGNLSCAAASCHAGGYAGGRAGSEYGTWAGGDPHSRASDVLANERSRRMVELLHRGRSGKPTPAHRDVRCLSCHGPEAVADARPAQGVGCESCHGPAEKWLTAHYQADFKSLSVRDKAERYGLYPTRDLAFRVTLCASCHVGDADREVDHDLIAAGHPRLAFEYTGYHHSPKYSRHWQETAPDFDAHAWEVGQVACARAAAKLLAARTRPGHAWPELSEYSCFACHKDLDAQNRWKPLTAVADRKPGSMPWGTWYFSTLDLVTDERPAELRDLARLMELPTTDTAAVARKANDVATRLDHRLRALQRAEPYTSNQLARRFAEVSGHALTADGRRFRDADWDGVTQHYLGAAANYYAWGAVDPAGRDARVRPALEGLGASLRFPKGYNSPTGADPARLLDLFRQLRPDRDRHP